VVAYFEAYAEKIDASIRCGVEVLSVQKTLGSAGFDIHTSDGQIHAEYVVAATGAYQKPVIPQVIPEDANIQQLHSSSYRNPQQLPEGATLVVGAGSSGIQIADDIQKSGRQVYLSVGPHERPPRRYRGRDFVWWLGVLNKWEAIAPSPDAEHVTISVSGAGGGHTVDLRNLAASGITLLGRTESYEGGVLRFAPDLAQNIADGDANYLALLGEADAYIERNGLDLPEEPEARHLGPLPACAESPVRELDIAEAGITSIVWATGFIQDYSWLKVDAVDEKGRPLHQRGISTEPGIYFLGLPWQSNRGSSFIWGVWHDAKYLADQIMTQRSYRSYRVSDRYAERSRSTDSGTKAQSATA
jgi:putative flavoprotein involved in K+ transport